MTPKQALEHFGYQKAIAKAANRSEGAVSQWIKADCIPWIVQLRLESETNGVLVADEGIPRGHKGRKRK